MLAKDLINKTIEELSEELKKLLEGHLHLRMDAVVSGVQDTSQFKKTRKNIARVRTVLRKKMM